MATIDKRALIEKLREDIARSVSVLTRAANDAREAATHEEAKPENDKDTRAVEAAYLAGAQADRARDLERASAALAALDLKRFGPDDAISAAALIALDQGDDESHWYFLAPQGGGLRAVIEGVEVQVITPQAPLGKELLGKSVGDTVEIRVQGKLRSYEIVQVA
ncbi:MAG: GreA/GreB family elongation factor [Minicystis sp.]